MWNKALLLFLLVAFTSCFQSQNVEQRQVTVDLSHLGLDEYGMSERDGIIKTVYGNIIFKFYPRHAPNTVARILKLMNTGFYNGLIFHRVVPNMIIQGGDPSGTGVGGSGKRLKAEFNSIQHIKGTMAMARSKEVDSADSQFYVALATLPLLDGKYTVFGQVVDGLDVLHKVKKGDKILEMYLRKKMNKRASK